MTPTARLIAARFTEAADVERRLPRVSGPRTGSWWPAFDFTAEDRAGWTDQDRADDRERWSARRDITAGELSRYSEVVDWTVEHVPEKMRRMVWTWALCQVVPGWSFVTACNRHGWARSTAYSRLERLWSDLATIFANEHVLLRPPDERFSRLSSQDEASICEKVEEHVRREVVPAAVIYERSTDTLKTPEAIAAFIDHLHAVNSDRRRDRARRFRSKEGAPANG